MTPPSATAPAPARFAAPVVCLLSFGAVAAGLFWARSSWVAMLLYHLVIAVALAVRSGPRIDLGALRRGFSWRPALLACGASVAAGAGFFAALGELDPAGELFAAFVAGRGPAPSTIIPFVLYVSTVNPVLEELYWRGNYHRRDPSASLHDFYYSLFHVPVYLCFAAPAWALLPVVILAFAGRGWRYAANRCGGLAVPVLGHAAGNLSLMVAVGIHLHAAP
ncbi:MAG: CPBP family intramembrane metalloprotease [Akkermansiaceae bacterium]|nr:CPBP family intramembrane metalloprotease [Akkermansiaceae bacterium]